MNAEQWTTEEAILVLDLYMSKPKGMKPPQTNNLSTWHNCWAELPNRCAGACRNSNNGIPYFPST